MFRMVLVVEDKNLAPLLHDLTKHRVTFLEPVAPITAAKEKKTGGVKSTIPEGGSKGVIMKAFAEKDSFTINEGREALVKAGYQAASFHALNDDLIKAKIVRRIERGVYTMKGVKK